MKKLKVEKSSPRLDLFLVEALGVSRKKAKQLVDAGRIQHQGKKIIIASWQLKVGDTVEVLDPEENPLPRRSRYVKIHFEDADILVVEKPSGVACERTAQTLTSTLVDDLNDYLRRAHPEKPYPYLGLMHRLDRETSGLMVYSLSKRANRLSRDFRSHRIGRCYWALVEGSVKASQGRIDRALRKDPRSGGKKMLALQASGKGAVGRAVTDYRVLQRFAGATLIEARLLTGRTHQVRVHMASLGHPILGDSLYGSTMKAPRLMLHAATLDFLHPVSEKKLKFHSKPPKDFQVVLERLQKKV